MKSARIRRARRLSLGNVVASPHVTAIPLAASAFRPPAQPAGVPTALVGDPFDAHRVAAVGAVPAATPALAAPPSGRQP